MNNIVRKYLNCCYNRKEKCRIIFPLAPNISRISLLRLEFLNIVLRVLVTQTSIALTYFNNNVSNILKQKNAEFDSEMKVQLM